MASRKPKPIEVRPNPISINPHAAHKPEDTDLYNPPEDGSEDGQDSREPVEQTLEEARAEEAASAATDGHQDSDSDDANDSVTIRIKLKWTPAMKAAALNAIYDYRESAGAMPSILDLFEILQGDEAFAHLDGKTNHKGAPLFSPLSLQSGVNAIRKRVAKDIANGDTEQAPLPSLARVQVERTKRVTDTRALGLLIAEREAKLRAAKETESTGGAGEQEG